MKYSIGEFAELLGVTVDTLRLYERHGIIKPIKDHKNNYRYFDDLDARNLLMSRWYRSMQIPLQDVADLTKEASLEDSVEKIRRMELHLKEEIRKSTALLSKIIEIDEDIKKIEAALNKCVIKKVPGMYRLKQTRGNTLLTDDFRRAIVSKWMNMLPYAFYSFRIDSKIFSSGEKCLEYSWGIAISEDEINNFDVEINEHIEYIGPQTCLSTVIATPHGEYILRDSLQFMVDHIAENDYCITGDIIGRIIITEKINGQSRSYLEVNIPIQPKK